MATWYYKMGSITEWQIGSLFHHYLFFTMEKASAQLKGVQSHCTKIFPHSFIKLQSNQDVISTGDGVSCPRQLWKWFCPHHFCSLQTTVSSYCPKWDMLWDDQNLKTLFWVAYRTLTPFQLHRQWIVLGLNVAYEEDCTHYSGQQQKKVPQLLCIFG